MGCKSSVGVLGVEGSVMSVGDCNEVMEWSRMDHSINLVAATSYQ